MGYQLIHPSRIDANPSNPRNATGDVSELADSIRAQGLLQPLLVQPHPFMPTRFELLAGHRRLAAAKKAGLQMVPALIRPRLAGGSRAAIELMLVENCQREGLNQVELAEALGSLRACGRTTTQICQATGLSQSTVSRHLALLELDQASLERVRGGVIKPAAAVEAVRTVRAAQRYGRTGQRRAPVTVAAPHFSREHQLAGAARCSHPRKLPGGIACGRCWEDAIRADATIPAAAT